MSQRKDEVLNGLCREMLKEEDILIEADSVLKKAQTEFDVASRKYAAVRDMLTKYLGHSPYWLYEDEETSVIVPESWGRGSDPTRYGNYRFIYMTIGNAVVATLKEKDRPLALEQIVQILRTGGITRSESSLMRAVNAALMRTAGIDKTKDGKYQLEETEGVKIEDLPF